MAKGGGSAEQRGLPSCPSALEPEAPQGKAAVEVFQGHPSLLRFPGVAPFELRSSLPHLQIKAWHSLWVSRAERWLLGGEEAFPRRDPSPCSWTSSARMIEHPATATVYLYEQFGGLL